MTFKPKTDDTQDSTQLNGPWTKIENSLPSLGEVWAELKK